ncbi:unnamed protein product [Anisakis simplex]|uniref:Aa_trans domain-containing protein n=1 Tax=Anisakis simplex TaxID=6269 RepID=A0A0M3K901_ANISI|nr:unnamed protein product [Anisakis simplex]
MAAATTYTSYVLGECWVIMQRRWPEYRDYCRKPYPEIGQRAMGPIVKLIVTICIDITQFGIAVVYLLLSSKNIHDFLEAFFETDFSFCYIIIIMCICLLPVTFLKSPQDFWLVIVVGMVTTLAAVVLILVGSALDYGTCAHVSGKNTRLVPTNYFLALVLILIYVPVSVVGYLTYGNSIQSSIINSIQVLPIQQIVNVFITIHCVLTLTIVFNPLNQDAEEVVNAPHHFGWQRVLVRTFVMMAVGFIAETIPNFGPLLDLVGGSTITLTALVFPCLFYLYLSVGEDAMNSECTSAQFEEYCDKSPSFSEVIQRTPKRRLIICAAVITLAIVGGAATTYSAIRELVTTQFSLPCYLRSVMNALESGDSTGEGTSMNCCGLWQNVSRTGDNARCSKFIDFYNQYD